jgi:hypothetical protein
MLVLLESSCAATHDFALADQFGVEFGSVKGQVDVEIYSVECTVGGIHAFEIFFEVFA